MILAIAAAIAAAPTPAAPAVQAPVAAACPEVVTAQAFVCRGATCAAPVSDPVALHALVHAVP